MGMYTELCIGVEFKKDCPKEFIDVIQVMISEDTVDDVTKISPNLRSHPLFDTDRWYWMLRSGGSYYFDAKPCLVFEYDEISESWFLTVITNIKNYSNEWEHFLNFICPYLQSKGFIGYMRYETWEHPVLIYVENGKIMYGNTQIKDFRK